MNKYYTNFVDTIFYFLPMLLKKVHSDHTKMYTDFSVNIRVKVLQPKSIFLERTCMSLYLDARTSFYPCLAPSIQTTKSRSPKLCILGKYIQ